MIIFSVKVGDIYLFLVICLITTNQYYAVWTFFYNQGCTCVCDYMSQVCVPTRACKRQAGNLISDYDFRESIFLYENVKILIQIFLWFWYIFPINASREKHL